MFSGDTTLKVANLAGWDLRNVTAMGWMFDRTQDNMQKLILDNWQLNPDADTQQMFSYAFPKEVSVTGMKNINSQILGAYVNSFRITSTLTSIDLSSTTLSPKVQSLMFAFRNLSHVKSINLSGWDISQVTNLSSVFAGDTAVETINLNGWDFRNAKGLGGAMFYGCNNLKTLDLGNAKFADLPNVTNNDSFGFVSNITKVNLDGAENVPSYLLQEFVVAARNSHAATVDLSTFTVAPAIDSLDSLFQDLPDVETINLTGLDTANVTTMRNTFRRDYKLTKIIGLNTLNTSKVTSMEGMFTQDTSLADVDLSGLDTTKLTDISHLFDGDQNLAKLNLSGWVFQEGIKDDDVFQNALGKLTALDLTNAKTIPASVLRAYVAVARNTKAKDIDLSTLSISRQITNMSGLFADLPAVETINVANLYTGNVTDMSYMFNNDPQLTQIIGVGGFDTHNVTNMNSMFGAYHYNTVNNDEPLALTYFGRLKELDLSNWDTSKVTDMGDMFEALAALPDDQLTNLNWDTSKVENMWAMFYGMTLQKELSFVNNWNTANVRNMSYMFAEDPNLTRLDLSKWDVGKVGTDLPVQNYSLAAMFADDRALTSVGDISHWNTANVHDTRYMFGNTASLPSLDLSGWDTGNLEIAGHMFERSGVKEVNLSNWDFHNLKHYNNYGLVDRDGEFRGTEWMFINLLNKCVITMNNISLPDGDNAFSIIDFAGTKPIVVLANGQDGQALPELAALNQQTWKPWNVENEQEITGRQNSNVLTLVKAADPTVKVGERKLNFVFTNQTDLENYLNAQLAASQVKSAIGSFGQRWDQQGDTSNGRLKASLRLYLAAGDNFLADWVTPEYQLSTAKPVTPTTPDNPGTTAGNKPGMPGRGGADTGTGLNNPQLPGWESTRQGGMNRHAAAALPQTGNQDNQSALVNRRHEK